MKEFFPENAYKNINLTNDKPNLIVMSDWPSEQFKSMVKQKYN